MFLRLPESEDLAITLDGGMCWAERAHVLCDAYDGASYYVNVYGHLQQWGRNGMEEFQSSKTEQLLMPGQASDCPSAVGSIWKTPKGSCEILKAPREVVDPFRGRS